MRCLSKVLRASAVGACLAILMASSVSAAEQHNAVAQVPTGFTVGHLIVGTGSATLEEYKPDGSLVATSSGGGLTQEAAGSVIGGDGNLYVTNFQGGTVERFDPGLVHIGTFASGFTNPESIVRMASGNFLVGDAGSGGVVTELDPAGAVVAIFSVAIEDRGTDWIDLAADQCTLYYTSEGTTIFRFDVCTKTQLPAFSTSLPDLGYALRILGDGSILVADTTAAYRLDSSGNITNTYTPTDPVSILFGLNLDPDGSSFWTADLGTGHLFRFDIATGLQLKSFASDTNEVAGLTVVGEPTAAGGRTLAALGDSYSSGEGNPNFDQDSIKDKCHRSSKAWPRLIGQADPQILLVSHVACSGAKIDALTSRFKGEPAQLDDLRSLTSAPTFVTITIGGNDVGFASILADCFTSLCSDDGRLDQAQSYIKNQLPALLANAYTSIKAASPQSQVVIVGYPRLFPKKKSNVTNCGWLNDAERTGLNNLASQFDRVAATAAKQVGVAFVSVLDSEKNHELCTADSWINPIRARGSGNAHPNFQGQQAIGRIVMRYLDAH
jgi:lysophospholipase L1-like esterase